jgi:hypothetical protein
MFQYDYKVVGGELHINAGLMPTLAELKGKSPCLG